MQLSKSKFGDACNGCGYCCSVQPCMLAREFLNCHTGPCMALESQQTRYICGLVRNPLAYLYKAAHPTVDVPLLDPPQLDEVASQLSADLARALGLGMGCDSDDNPPSLAAWNAGVRSED